MHLLSGHAAAQIAPEQGQKQGSDSSSNTKFRLAEKNKCCCHKRMGPHSALPGCRTRGKGPKLHKGRLRSDIRKQILRGRVVKHWQRWLRVEGSGGITILGSVQKMWEVALGDMG